MRQNERTKSREITWLSWGCSLIQHPDRYTTLAPPTQSNILTMIPNHLEDTPCPRILPISGSLHSFSRCPMVWDGDTSEFDSQWLRSQIKSPRLTLSVLLIAGRDRPGGIAPLGKQFAGCRALPTIATFTQTGPLD